MSAPSGDAGEQMAGLVRLARAMATARSLPDLVDVAADEARFAFGAASVSVSRVEREHGLVRVLVNVGVLAPGEERRPRDETYMIADFPLLAAIVEDAEPWLMSVDDDGGDPAQRDLVRRLGAHSAMAGAVLYEGRVWGELFMTRGAEQPPFDSEDLAFLAAFAGLISAGLAQLEHLGRVEKMAFQDPLTGLGNRHRIEEQLDLAITRFNRDAAPVTVVMADVNKLKQANDEHGHDAGDKALIAVANALSVATGTVPGAVAGRMGGDEFCVVLPGYDLEVGEALAAAFLRGTLTAPHGVSVACGVASTDLMHGPVTAGLLLAMADGAQYQAKRAGARHPVTADPDFSFEARRERRDRADPPGLLPTALAALAAERGAGPAARLAASAAAIAGAIGATGWVVSRLRAGAAVPALLAAPGGSLAGVSVPAPESAAWMALARAEGAVVDAGDDEVPLAAIRGCARVVVAAAGEWMVELLCQQPPPADAPSVLRAAVGVALTG